MLDSQNNGSIHTALLIHVFQIIVVVSYKTYVIIVDLFCLLCALDMDSGHGLVCEELGFQPFAGSGSGGLLWLSSIQQSNCEPGLLLHTAGHRLHSQQPRLGHRLHDCSFISGSMVRIFSQIVELCAHDDDS